MASHAAIDLYEARIARAQLELEQVASRLGDTKVPETYPLAWWALCRAMDALDGSLDEDS